MTFDDLLRKLRNLQRNAEALDGEHSLPFTELFPDEFMLRNTDFPSIDAFLTASGFSIASTEDTALPPDERWDPFVTQHTRFGSWGEMKDAAAQEWGRKRLGLD